MEHTATDLAYFAAVGINPAATQPNETVKTCLFCMAPTMNQMRGCDAHYMPRHSRPWTPPEGSPIRVMPDLVPNRK